MSNSTTSRFTVILVAFVVMGKPGRSARLKRR